MTTTVDIANRSLQAIGSRTTLTQAQLTNQSNNEAKQIQLSFANTRDSLLRMAPWDCAIKTSNLNYITSVPGTPENTSPATPLWTPGQPAPPWAYEYQYPVDCLRACWVIPATQTGFADGVPITTAVTGGAANFWAGGPIRFKVQSDEFYPVTAAAPAVGGSGYVVGEIVTLVGNTQGAVPKGAPAQILVLTVDGSGAILTCVPVSVINDSTLPSGGSYFAPQANPVAQGSTTGVGTGATFNLTFDVKGTQRVILTNQEFATLAYVKQVIDPNVMDPLFTDAWTNVLGATVVMALTGDKSLANMLIKEANDTISAARAVDGNEGLTINDVTPDWIRIRGVTYTEGLTGPYGQGFEWGAMWPSW